MASEGEIKRSYRRLVSRYHPDINPSPDAHYILIEINEAYATLGDPEAKWIYDQHLLYRKENRETAWEPQTFTKPRVDPRKARRGSKETEQQKAERRIFIKWRNSQFNKKMRLLSIVSLLFSSLIFVDHYLPPVQSFRKVYAPFQPSQVVGISNEVFTVFLTQGRKLDLRQVGRNEEAIGLLGNEGLFSVTPVFGVVKTIQVGKIILKPLDGLHDIMLFYGVVCMASLFVIGYQLEKSLVLPTIITFFSNMAVLTFFTMWLME